MVGGSRAAADDTASGGSAACPKPLVLLSKTLTFHKKYPFYLVKRVFSKKIRVLLSKTIVFIENRTQGSPSWSGMLWGELWEGLGELWESSGNHHGPRRVW